MMHLNCGFLGLITGIQRKKNAVFFKAVDFFNEMTWPRNLLFLWIILYSSTRILDSKCVETKNGSLCEETLQTVASSGKVITCPVFLRTFTLHIAMMS